MHKTTKKCAHKKLKKVKEKELPSFLLNLKVSDENRVLLKKITPDVYWGPIFFGCKQYQPPFYAPNPTDSASIFIRHHGQRPRYTTSYKENFLKGIFLPKPVVERHVEVRKSFHPVIKSRKVFTDIYPHKCPGSRKVFKPKFAPPIINFGETKSIIEGEASREIPLYCLKKVSPGTLETKFEFVTLSDIRERKRDSLPYKERIAHPHFPKEFVTLRVIGPTIPASLTITKIRSKREYEIEMDITTQSETNKAEKNKKKVKTEKETEEEIIEEEKLNALEEIVPVEEEEKEEVEEVESVEENEFKEDEQSKQSQQSLLEMNETTSVDEEIEEREMEEVGEEQDKENFEDEESEMEN